MSKRAFGYIRVSSIGQATEGVSLDAQQERLNQWAAFNDVELVGVESDGGKSGGRMSNRPGLRRALDLACQEKGIFVVYSLSRMARSTKDATAVLDRLRDSGAQFVSISENIDTTTAAGRMFFVMLAGFAAFEREIGGERTAESLHLLKSKGQRYSRLIPFGQRLGADGKSLEIDPAERQALLRIKGLDERGYSLRRIVAVLSDEGIRRRNGSPIGIKAVRLALVRQAA